VESIQASMYRKFGELAEQLGGVSEAILNLGALSIVSREDSIAVHLDREVFWTAFRGREDIEEEYSVGGYLLRESCKLMGVKFFCLEIC